MEEAGTRLHFSFTGWLFVSVNVTGGVNVKFAMSSVERCLMGLLLLASCSRCQTEIVSNCDYKLWVKPGVTPRSALTISYPDDSFTLSDSQIWCVSAPSGMTLSLDCQKFDIPQSENCVLDALTVTTNKNKSWTYCGSKPVQADYNSNELTIMLRSNLKSREGMFSCQVVAEQNEPHSLRAIIYEGCDCGYSSKLKIVGGVETGINEFPFMAGIVDRRRGAFIYCGAVIISPWYVLTAEHCLLSLVPNQTAIVVGEHNIATGSETSATKAIRVKRFIHYPYYNSQKRQYDIALIELASPVSYGLGVGPVCLPFMSRNWDLTGQVVTILGWGTTEFGGPRSKYLRKVHVDVIDISNCNHAYGDTIETYTQLCTYRKNSDACQYDSGGPLLLFNSNINRYELAGVVGYGKGCGTDDPSVNTKVAPFLQWILDNTQSETYCYKSQ